MNWEAIGAIGEIIGALAVLVTLIYLATQVKQSAKQAQENARATKALIRLHIGDSVLSINEKLLESEHLQNIVIKAQLGEPLTDKEGKGWTFYAVSLFRVNENAYRQYIDGYYSAEDWILARGVLLALLDNQRFPTGAPITLAWWDRSKSLYHKDFVTEVERERIAQLDSLATQSDSSSVT